MKSTIEKDNKAFAEVANELISSGALDKWLQDLSGNQLVASAKSRHNNQTQHDLTDKHTSEEDSEKLKSDLSSF